MQPSSKILTIPTVLTLSRIALVPFMVWSLINHQWIAATIFFSAAALTDVLDGALARYLKEESWLGTCLDPIADRLWLLSCYGALVAFPSPLGKIPGWIFACVVIKELMILLGAFLFGIIGRAVAVKPLIWGKVAGIVQSAFLLFVFAGSAWYGRPMPVFSLLLLGTFVFTMIPLVHYGTLVVKGLCRHGA